MNPSQPRFLELLRTPIKELVDNGSLVPKQLVCVTKDQLLQDCLPLIDIKQQSQSNPHGVTTLIVTPKAEGRGIPDLSAVTLLDAREIITVFHSHLKQSQRMDTERILTSFLALTMEDIVAAAPKIDTLKFADWNSRLANILGEFGANSRIIVTKPGGPDGTDLLFVFSVKDFLQLLESQGLMTTLGDKSGNPNELNSTPLLSFGSTLRKPLSLLTDDSNSLLCVLKDEPVTNALSKLAVTHHRGMPVLMGGAGGGRPTSVMAIISTSDFITYFLHWKDFLSDGVDILSASTLPFVSMVKQFVCLQAINPCISMTLESTLYDTLQKMKACKVHRLMICNNSNDVCGLISISDIGKFIASEMAAVFDEAVL